MRSALLLFVLLGLFAAAAGSPVTKSISFKKVSAKKVRSENKALPVPRRGDSKADSSKEIARFVPKAEKTAGGDDESSDNRRQRLLTNRVTFPLLHVKNTYVRRNGDSDSDSDSSSGSSDSSSSSDSDSSSSDSDHKPSPTPSNSPYPYYHHDHDDDDYYN